MGKDLKGKELGKGICQRKDGLYSARCTQHGQSYGRYFKTVKEAKQWLKEFSAKPKSKIGSMVADAVMNEVKEVKNIVEQVREK